MDRMRKKNTLTIQVIKEVTGTSSCQTDLKEKKKKKESKHHLTITCLVLWNRLKGLGKHMPCSKEFEEQMWCGWLKLNPTVNEFGYLVDWYWIGSKVGLDGIFPSIKKSHHLISAFCVYLGYLCLILRLIWWSDTRYQEGANTSQSGICILITWVYQVNLMDLCWTYAPILVCWEFHL